jgi:hypothetical protein
LLIGLLPIEIRAVRRVHLDGDLAGAIDRDQSPCLACRNRRWVDQTTDGQPIQFVGEDAAEGDDRVGQPRRMPAGATRFLIASSSTPLASRSSVRRQHEDAAGDALPGSAGDGGRSLRPSKGEPRPKN